MSFPQSLPWPVVAIVRLFSIASIILLAKGIASSHQYIVAFPAGNEYNIVAVKDEPVDH